MKQLKKHDNTIITEAGATTTARPSGKLNQLLSVLTFGLGGIGKPVVAVLRLEGVIGKISPIKSGLTICALNQLIEKMFKIENLAAVCLCINSPGGSPVQSELIANRIINLSHEKNIAVYSFIEDVAASGGYWLACAGKKIFTTKNSIIGSIGVISSGFGFHEAIKKLGIERRIYTQGKSKSILDPFTPEKDADVKIIMKAQQAIHNHFIETVKFRRNGKLTQTDDILFSGAFWAGQVAVDYGLADGINDLHSFIKEEFGEEIKIEYIEQQQSWLKKKMGINSNHKDFADTIVNNLVESLEDKIMQKMIQSKFDIY